MQIYTSNHTAKAFGRLTELFAELTPYHKAVAEETVMYGYPAQRPLFFHYPDDPIAQEMQFQYLYGEGSFSNQIFHYTRGIRPKRVTSLRAHLRVIAPGQPSIFRGKVTEVVSHNVSDLTGPRFEPQTSRSRDERATDPSTSFSHSFSTSIGNGYIS